MINEDGRPAVVVLTGLTGQYPARGLLSGLAHGDLAESVGATGWRRLR